MQHKAASICLCVTTQSHPCDRLEDLSEPKQGAPPTLLSDSKTRTFLLGVKHFLLLFVWIEHAWDVG